MCEATLDLLAMLVMVPLTAATFVHFVRLYAAEWRFNVLRLLVLGAVTGVVLALVLRLAVLLQDGAVVAAPLALCAVVWGFGSAIFTLGVACQERPGRLGSVIGKYVLARRR